MRPGAAAARAGWQRGWTEFRQVFAAGEIMGWLWPSIVGLIVLYVLRDRTVPGTGFSIAAHAIPGFLAMNLIYTGVMALSVALTVEREDGTLLRMRAVPNGTLGYLIGKLVGHAALSIAVLLIVLVPGALLFDGLRLGSLSAWLGLLALVVFGLVATLPLGAVIGSLFRNVQALSVFMLLIMGLTAVSGVFYPLTALPGWLQAVGQVFPLYWLGLGMRSALLPDAMVNAEIGQSWRTVETIGVLGAWAVTGFLLALVLLRRAARRTAGTPVPATETTTGS